MAVKRNGLGKGLDSLIPNKTVKTTEKQANKTQKEKVKVEKSGETIVKITQVEPNSEQPRKDFDEDALLELADSIKQFGVLQPLLVYRFKTGTPARIDKRSIDFGKMEEQKGDERIVPFSFTTDPEDIQIDQVSCWLTYTNEKTHEIIRENLDRSPLFSGMIEGTGPRYCPSI